jgi:hypothetical protein
VLDNRNSAYFNPANIPPVGQQPVQEKEQKRGFRDKLGFGHGSRASQDTSSSSKQGPLGRSLSVSKSRKPENPEKYYAQQSQGQGQGQGLIDNRSPYRRSANSSQNLLNTHTEEDEDSQHNSYPGQQFPGPPRPPAKEGVYEQNYPQQVAPPQAYYQDPRSLARVNTDQTLQQSQIGHVDLRSPSGHSYQYQEEGAQHPQDPYQAYQPAEEEGAPVTPYQTSPEDAARYSYSQQPPAYSQHTRVPSGSAPQPELHYPQPGPSRASLENYRPSSQPKVPQLHEQKYDAPNPLFLQPPLRGSSLDPPPSPLVPAGLPPLGHQNEPLPPPSPQPPSTADSAQSSLDLMPNQSRGNNTNRVAGDKAAGSRESSGMQSPPPVPPHKQGVAAFGANVIPSGSQGAPYRGQQATVAAAVASQEARESPVPKGVQQMAPAELVDEEAASYLQLQKEYKELRKS